MIPTKSGISTGYMDARVAARRAGLMALSLGVLGVRWKDDCCAGRVVATRADLIVASSVGWRVGQKADCWAKNSSFSMTEVTGRKWQRV